MSNIVYPSLNRSEVPTPPAGFQKLFNDLGNGNRLTSKDSNCSFDVISVTEVSQDALNELADVVDRITKDAGCAMTKGIITADQYESIIDNLNVCIEINIDPVTGSQQICYSNTPTLFLALSSTNVLCNGDSNGTASVLITGGTAPFATTYTTLGGVPVVPGALAAGTFIVTVVDANAKTKAQTFIITEPAALSSVNSSTPETGAGNDGTASVVISGGTQPYTYLWDDPGAQITPTAIGLAAGNFNCAITDANGCVLNEGPIVVA